MSCCYEAKISKDGQVVLCFTDLNNTNNMGLRRGLKEERKWQDLEINNRTTLRRILRKLDGRINNGFSVE
jgi:hypothetical protein